MKILICDDDSCFTEQLYAYIRRYFTLRKTDDYEIAVFHDGASLLANCEDAALVFLDIEMPGMNGIETGNALKAGKIHTCQEILVLHKGKIVFQGTPDALKTLADNTSGKEPTIADGYLSLM